MTAAQDVWTPKSLLDWTESYFDERGVPSPRLDAELLLAHVLGCRRIDLYLRFDQPLTERELARFRELVRARGQRRPLAYLIGEADFWSLTLAVREGILIPSPDTETLVEGILAAIGALRSADPERPLWALELGTGSAAIPLAVCSEVRGLRWVAVERSPAAMAVAAENRRRHAALLEPRDNALHLVLGDRFEPIAAGFRPHIVAGNPPYIPTGTIDRLMPEVSRAEPRLALNGGRDGGDFQRYMLAYAERSLAPGGHVLMEMGSDQERRLRGEVTQHAGLRLVEVRNDLAGHPRVLHAAAVGPGGAGPAGVTPGTAAAPRQD
ncbi:MAG TPA: peptide chain release factor N(5)-glutamine methyltransferase [bacterium]|nr:peptide chain release factor N(5)-glutamine methyltransferase [bacterium]